MARQKITFIRGIPGSSKTTMALKLNAKLVEAEQFFENRNSEYKQDRQRFIRDAHSWCQLDIHGVSKEIVARMKTQFEKINPKQLCLSCPGVKNEH